MLLDSHKLIANVLIWALGTNGHISKERHEEAIKLAVAAKGTAIATRYVQMLVDDLLLCGFSVEEISKAMQAATIRMSPLTKSNTERLAAYQNAVPNRISGPKGRLP